MYTDTHTTSHNFPFIILKCKRECEASTQINIMKPTICRRLPIDLGNRKSVNVDNFWGEGATISSDTHRLAALCDECAQVNDTHAHRWKTFKNDPYVVFLLVWFRISGESMYTIS